MSWSTKALVTALAGAGVGVLGTVGVGLLLKWLKGRKGAPREAFLEDRPTRQVWLDRWFRYDCHVCFLYNVFVLSVVANYATRLYLRLLSEAVFTVWFYCMVLL